MKKATLLLIVGLTFTFSCSNEEKIRKRDILKEDEFYQILKDIHLADGVIAAGNLRYNVKKTDSASLYNYVLKKHNVSREKFGKTVKYYSKHTGQYVKMYDSLISEFTVLQKELKDKEQVSIQEDQERIKAAEDSLNLWKMKKKWYLPRDGETNPIAYKYDLKKHGTYTLKAKIRVFRDDKSINQRMTIIANYTDGTKDLNTMAINLKDNNFYNYDVSITTNREKELSNISGWLLDHSKNTTKKHVQVIDIELRYTDDKEEQMMKDKEIKKQLHK